MVAANPSTYPHNCVAIAMPSKRAGTVVARPSTYGCHHTKVTVPPRSAKVMPLTYDINVTAIVIEMASTPA